MSHLENILLALLAKPASGYDLKRTFETTINHFWYADIAQIYRTLQRMEQSGTVKCKEIPSEQGPARKVYRRTPAGRKQLFAWLQEDPVETPERRTSVAQLVFMGQLGDLDETARFLQQLRDQLVLRLAVLNEIKAEEPDPDRMNDEDLHGFLGLEMAIAVTQSRIAGCDSSLEIVQERISGRRIPQA